MTVTTPEASWTIRSIRRKIDELAPWFHNIDLMGVPTAPRHFLGDYPRIKWERFQRAIPTDLRGASVLDIGCNAGFYSMEMKTRGAGRVLGIDWDERYLAQARFAAEVCGADVEFRRLSVWDIGSLGEKFDLVLFMGVLYHLRHPLLALDLIHEHVARDLLLFQSMQRGSRELMKPDRDYAFEEEAVFDDPAFPKLHFIERSYCDDPTNWWLPNRSCVEAMLQSAGFRIEGRPEEEVYLCRRRSLTPEEEQFRAVYPARGAATAGEPHWASQDGIDLTDIYSTSTVRCLNVETRCITLRSFGRCAKFPVVN
jgi:tRNA (mo5U34)-methyltransferase